MQWPQAREITSFSVKVCFEGSYGECKCIVVNLNVKFKRIFKFSFHPIHTSSEPWCLDMLPKDNGILRAECIGQTRCNSSSLEVIGLGNGNSRKATIIDLDIWRQTDGWSNFRWLPGWVWSADLSKYKSVIMNDPDPINDYLLFNFQLQLQNGIMFP